MQHNTDGALNSLSDVLTKNGTEKLKRTDERNLDIKSRGKNRVKNIGVRSKSVHLEIFRPCWRCMANSLKDPIEFVALRRTP